VALNSIRKSFLKLSSLAGCLALLLVLLFRVLAQTPQDADKLAGAIALLEAGNPRDLHKCMGRVGLVNA
jgi:hypothetical protein